MSSLIQIHRDYLSILDQIKDNGGEITEQIETDLIKNLIQSKEKVSNYCLVLDKYESEISFMKAKVKEAVAFIDRLEKQKEHLERIALEVVKSKGEKLEGENGNWINKRKSKSLEIVDENSIPDFYKKISVSLDKASIKGAIAMGEEVPGAIIKENESLQWK